MSLHFFSGATLKSIAPRLKCSMLVLFISTLSHISFGQYNISIGVNYVHAFGERDVDFQNETYALNGTNGYEITANNSFRFQKTNISGLFKVGFRQLYFSGNSENLSYSGQLNKLIGSLGVRYSLSEKLGISGFIEAENNLDLKEFNTGTGDLFRICLSLEASYLLTDKLGVTFLTSRAMTPITEAYIISNPQYQVRLGLIYQFLK